VKEKKKKEREESFVFLLMNQNITILLLFISTLCISVLAVNPSYPNYNSYKLHYSSAYRTNSFIISNFGTSWYLLTTQPDGSELHQSRWDISTSSSPSATVLESFYQFEIRNNSNDQHIRSLDIYQVDRRTGSCSLSHTSNVPGHETSSKCSLPVYTSHNVSVFSYNTTCVKVDGEVWLEEEYFSMMTDYPSTTIVTVYGEGTVSPSNYKGTVTESYWGFVVNGANVRSVFDLPLSCGNVGGGAGKKREAINLVDELKKSVNFVKIGVPLRK